MIGSEKNEKNEKKARPCAFITMHEKSIFNELVFPSVPSNFVLWISKENPSEWGFTVKKFPDGGKYGQNHTWKLSYKIDQATGVLVATKDTLELIDGIKDKQVTRFIEGDLKEKLEARVNDYVLKNNIKKN